ncbi:uncharacterized protein EI90DRAFT_3129999 [Cantharellus anzutake]|uniref:uncharacterized protein n=1 Tax=Cantharellus anzutake TaxID=1750568 RepID=UPI0019057FEB|nr:uncharacterized protein EI90DRAFT_3129999 [Cantharellus anzutake]KAF8324297.1 hypothetical protein EI90DRAFT_3129999 [Cantharellus anzutake]
MPSVQLVVPIVRTISKLIEPRWNGTPEGQGSADPSSDSLSTPRSAERGWLMVTISFILQMDRPPVFHPKYRWLPIISGLLVPFSILLEIPGLTEHWYVRWDKATQTAIEYRKNSFALTLGLATSIACAGFANAALMLRFLERHNSAAPSLKPQFSDIINIIAVSAFGYYGRHDDGFTYAQAYWSCVASTAISSITNITLVIDYMRTKNFADSGSGLTNKQRSLVIIVMILLVWIAAGAGVFTVLLEIPFQTALYFTVVTIETIGFGDFYPKHGGTRVFTFFYALIAILNLALAVTTMRGLIAESFRHARRLQRKRAARARAARERRRSETIHTYRQQEHLAVIIGTRSKAWKFAANVWLALRHPFGVDHGFEDHDSFHQDHGSPHVTRHDDKHLLYPRSADPKLDNTLEEEIRDNEETENVRQLTLALLAFIGFWLLGSLVFHLTEKWPYGTAMYFCFVAWTTIGYGDLTPKSNAGRAVFVLWALLGVGSLTILISVIGEAYAGVFGAALRNRTFEALVYDRVRARHDSLAAVREAGIRDFTEQVRNDKLKLSESLIEHAHKYHPHLRFMLGVEKRPSDIISENLRQLLVSELGDCEHTVRETIFHDPEIRKAVFIMSYDASFERLMQMANAVRMLEESSVDESPEDSPDNNILTADNDSRLDSVEASNQSSPRHKRVSSAYDADLEEGFDDPAASADTEKQDSGRPLSSA